MNHLKCIRGQSNHVHLGLMGFTQTQLPSLLAGRAIRAKQGSTLGYKEWLCGGSTYIPDHFVEGLEGGLLVIVVNPSVAVQDGDPLLLGPPAVAAVHAVVRPVVPLAGEHVQTLCPRWPGHREGEKTCQTGVTMN